MSDARHHRAHAPGTAIVLVPVPVGGSPEPSRAVKPRYPQQDRVPPWRPQRTIPTNRKAAAFKRLLDTMRELDRRAEDARAFMRQARHQAHQARCA